MELRKVPKRWVTDRRWLEAKYGKQCTGTSVAAKDVKSGMSRVVVWDVVVELGFLKHIGPQPRPHHSDRHLAGNDRIEAHHVSRSWRAQIALILQSRYSVQDLIAISGPFALPPLTLGQIRKSWISRDWLECASLHATFQWRRLSERLETWRGMLEPHHLDCPSPTFLPRALRETT